MVPMNIRIVATIATVIGIPVMLIYRKVYSQPGHEKAKLFFSVLPVVVLIALVLFWVL